MRNSIYKRDGIYIMGYMIDYQISNVMLYCCRVAQHGDMGLECADTYMKVCIMCIYKQMINNLYLVWNSFVGSSS